MIETSAKQMELIARGRRKLKIRRRPMKIQRGDRSCSKVGEKVLLKNSPKNGVMTFGKLGKFSPIFIGPLEILKRIVEAIYELYLP